MRHGEGKLGQLVIEERDPHLQGMGHAHPVHFGQKVVGEIDFAVQVEELVDQRPAARPFKK